ncbi:protocadherin beta-5-like [Nelusetta ayraudi]|uniref:protocadherin beta-5-like n=1 Tax=Nelusetta ayraudi TaxID=303726 RepID=UPI003F71D19A
MYYHYHCEGTRGKYQMREVPVMDINESPEFLQDSYNTTISEATEVNSWVLKITAEDKDIFPEFNTVTYSIVSPSDVFVINSTGDIFLNTSLNFNVAPKYNLTVMAQDGGGLNNTATVLIHVEDTDNLDPYFSHDTYQAFIAENEVSPKTSFW